jgi:hypothetical protein
MQLAYLAVCAAMSPPLSASALAEVLPFPAVAMPSPLSLFPAQPLSSARAAMSANSVRLMPAIPRARA